MTQQNKDLLLKDLCSRIPYGVKVQVDLQSDIYSPITCKVCSIECAESGSAFIGVETSPGIYNEFREFLCKPYLFPLSSMTKEQKREYNSLRDFVPTYHYEFGDIVEDTVLYDNFESIDYLIANHFDYRCLIHMGLAIDATGLNIY